MREAPSATPFLLALALAGLAASGASAQGAPVPMLHMQDHQYLPRTLEVEAGATIEAMNFGSSAPNGTGEPHTVTSATDRSLFDVQGIQPTGEAYPFQAPSIPGEYPFYCIYHGDAQGNGMAGLLLVRAASTPAPAPEGSERTPAPAFLALGALALAALLALRRR